MAKTTLGLDLSITHTGIVVCRKKVVHEECVQTLPSKMDYGQEARINMVLLKVIRVCREFDPDKVAIEGYAYGLPNRATLLGELGGVIKHWLYRKEIPFVIVPPMTLKKFATGKGNASKDEMVAIAQKHITTNDHNVADAYHLACYAAEVAK